MEESTRQKTLAVVGLSGKEARPSYRLARKMQRLGYKIIPVNPRETEILGEKAYQDLKSVPEQIDVVQVFRSPEAAIAIAEEALEVNPKVFWLQEGVISPKAADIAKEGGLQVVHNRCTYKEAQRLRGTISTYACAIVKAFIVLRKGFEQSPELLEEIRIFVRNNLAAHLAPKEIEVMAELPKTTISGKILRRELKQMEIEKVSAGNIV